MSKYLRNPAIAATHRTLTNVYMKIVPPRLKRLIYFAIYILLGVIGGISTFKPNQRLDDFAGGQPLIHFYGILIISGSLVCMLSVLPGVWIIERAGLVGLGTGIVLYVVTLMLFGASFTISLFPVIIILVFLLRWLDIKDYMLEPRKE